MTVVNEHVRGALLLSAFVLTPALLGAQGKADFIIRKGKDTVGVEHVTRDGPTVTGDLLQSNGMHTQYVLNLRPDSTVEHLEVSRQGPQGPAATFSVDLTDTLVRAAITAGSQNQNMTVRTSAKPMPFLIQSFGLLEQIVKASHPATGQSVRWTALRLGAGDTASISVSRVHADTVVITVPQGDLRLAVNKSGDVLGAKFAPQEWIVERRATKP